MPVLSWNIPKARACFLVALAIFLPWLCFFGPVVFTGKAFAFRDSAHYYYPLFHWTTGEWAVGRIPLWNPYENCGVPVLADTTSSVFYPGKLIFAATFLDYSTRYLLFVSLHVLLAAFGSFSCARCFSNSFPAATLCALAYAFGGNVVFQYSNVVFLVGAAWMPFAFLSSYKILRDRSLAWASALGVVLAIMTLGGDPQSSYHAGLLAVLLALLMWLSDSRASYQGTLWRQLALLSAAAIVGTLLAAVQILPAIEWSRQSDRAAFQQPRTVYEAISTLSRHNDDEREVSSLSGLFGQPQPGTHQDHIYHFSVSPWRAAEFVWPNISGKMFPENRRWTSALPSEDRIWTPSLYMGLLPLLLAMMSIRFRRGDVTDRWLSWIVVWFGVGALGWYGIGWLVHEARCNWFSANPGDYTFGAPVGGLYWLMVKVLPGYVYFRFPAKLMVVASLGISLLAAKGWDRAFGERRSTLPFCFLGVAIFSFVLVGTFALVQPRWNEWLAAVKSDDFYGPLDVLGASFDVLLALLHTSILSLLFWFLWRVRQQHASFVAASAIVITMIDLVVANHWMVASSSAKTELVNSTFPTGIEGKATVGGSRVYRGSLERWVPVEWRKTRSKTRQDEIVEWQRDTLFPKYHLHKDISVVEAYGTMASSDFLTWMQIAKEKGPARQDEWREPVHQILDLLSAELLLLPEGFSYSGTTQLPVAPRLADTKLWHNPSVFPRAWIVHQVKLIPAMKSRSPSALRRRTEAVMFDGDSMRQLRDVAVVETDTNLPTLGPIEPTESEAFEVVVLEPQRVELNVELAAGGLVVLNDLYYPGWVATATCDEDGAVTPLRIYRTNRIMRGVYLPEGRHRVVFRYRPLSFQIGAIASTLGWLLVTAWSLVILRSRASRLSASE